MNGLLSYGRREWLAPEDEDHGDGIVHAAGDLDGVHVAVFPAAGLGRSPGHRAAGSTFLGFWVPSLEAAMDALVPLGTEVVLEHQVCEWGCRMVVVDPDGRAVELNQRQHCPLGAGLSQGGGAGGGSPMLSRALTVAS